MYMHIVSTIDVFVIMTKSKIVSERRKVKAHDLFRQWRAVYSGLNIRIDEDVERRTANRWPRLRSLTVPGSLNLTLRK